MPVQLRLEHPAAPERIEPVRASIGSGNRGAILRRMHRSSGSTDPSFEGLKKRPFG
jgi:hypothetical protein